MKVLYDYAGFRKRIGGVGRYLCEIISHLPEDIEPVVSVRQADCVYLWEKGIVPGLEKPRLTNENYLPFSFKGKIGLFRLIEDTFSIIPSARNINRKYSIDLIKRGEFDLLHHTQYVPYFLPYIGKKPYVFTVHDCVHEIFHTDKALIRGKKALIPGAAHIIAVSENTKADVMDIYKVPESKITVIHHGGPDVVEDDSEAIIGSPYFLFVGRREGYKNFDQTARDFAVFSGKHPDVRLVCTGMSFTDEEQKLLQSLDIGDKVVQMFAGEKELANLYLHAIAFVFPSVYEGFGIPILEAYTFGCPVLLNHASCFPELAGDAAIYFHSEPGRSDLPEKLEQVFSLTPDARGQLIEKQRLRLQLYNWQKAAEQTADVYHNVLQR